MRIVEVEARCPRCVAPIDVEMAMYPADEGGPQPVGDVDCPRCDHHVGDPLPTPDMCVCCWDAAGTYTIVRPGRLWCDDCIREEEPFNSQE